jgi:molybdopterin synthase sulfur carrier subunit
VKVKVLFFAALREQVGVASRTSTFRERRARSLRCARILPARGGAWASALSEKKLLRFAVNQDMARTDATLKAGDEVAFFRR